MVEFFIGSKLKNKILRNIYDKIRCIFNRNLFLNDVIGVIHIGASSGQERFRYEEKNLNVLWVEAIPEVFKLLEKNIVTFKKQQAYQALITNKKTNTTFHIASNNGESSSIFSPELHERLFPKVTFSKKIKLNSISFSDFITKNKIKIKSYDSMVLDTQGSELLILMGAKDYLSNFKYIKTEVADFESYKGCAKFSELNSFMLKNGFRIYFKHKFYSKLLIGSYYDVTYKNINFD